MSLWSFSIGDLTGHPVQLHFLLTRSCGVRTCPWSDVRYVSASWPVQRERLSAAVIDVYRTLSASVLLLRRLVGYWCLTSLNIAEMISDSSYELVCSLFYSPNVGQLRSRVLGHSPNK